MSAEPKASPGIVPGDAGYDAIRKWIKQLPMAAWVVDSSRLLYISNLRAGERLEIRSAGDHHWRCPPDCPVCGLDPVSAGVHPRVIAGRRVLLFGIPHPEGPLVHCAIETGSDRRTESYLRNCMGGGPFASLGVLSLREREILQALAAGQRPESVAVRLHLSRTTVRNHIQHILRKLGHHSTRAAIAQWLLEAADVREKRL